MTELERANNRIKELETKLAAFQPEVLRIEKKVAPEDYQEIKKRLKIAEKENEVYRQFFNTNQFSVLHQLARDVRKDLEGGLKNLLEEFVRVRGGREERIIMNDILEVLQNAAEEIEQLIVIKENEM